VKAGYRAVKLKTGAGSPEDEAKRVRTVREAIGKDVSLMLDMNAPYDVDVCIEFARLVEPLDIYWLEEPLHWYLQPADFVRLAAATSIPLAHGERELTRFTVRDFIASGAIRYVQFDSTRAAGFTEGLRVAALAEQHAVMIAPHTAPELHAHLVAALPRCGFGVESHGDTARNRAFEMATGPDREVGQVFRDLTSEKRLPRVPMPFDGLAVVVSERCNEIRSENSRVPRLPIGLDPGAVGVSGSFRRGPQPFE